MTRAGKGVEIPSYAFRRLLEESPYTHAEIADAADVSDATVYRWAHGESTPAVAHVHQVYEYHRRRMSDLRELLARLDRDMDDIKRIMGVDSNGAEG